MSNLDLRHPEDGHAVALPGWRTARPQGSPGPHRTWKPAGSAAPQVRRNPRTSSANACAIARKSLAPHAVPAAGTLGQPGFRIGAKQNWIQPSLFVRLARLLSPPRNPGLRWALSGRSLLWLSAFVCRAATSRDPKVEAAALLQKAVKAAAIAPAPPSSACASPHAPAR